MGDYDRKPLAPPSQFLRLKSKGDQVRVRIASSPYRELKIWPATSGQPPIKDEFVQNLTPGQWRNVFQNVDYTVSEVFHYGVIDRADGTAKVFTTTGGVYGKVRDFATNPEWGDPRSYDLTITRTENPGKNYYEVTPSPNKFDLTADELQKIDALKISDKVPAALPNSAMQPDDGDMNIPPEPLPWESWTGPGAPAAAQPAPQPAAPAPAAETAPAPPAKPDVVIEDIGDEPINLDDIPF